MPLLRKKARQANIQLNKGVLKTLLYSYIIFTALLGFCVLIYVALGLLGSLVPADTPINLGNGFIWAEHPGEENNTRRLIDAQGQILVAEDVEGVSAFEKTVYGYRHLGTSDRFAYFICTLGQDCTHTQNYDDLVFKMELKKRGIPPFTTDRIQRISNGSLSRAFIKNILTINSR